MLKLTTDKHEASRGLSATAEFIVMYGCETWATTKYLLSRLDAFDTWHYTQDLEDTVYSACVKCGSQKNHWLFTAFSPGD